MDHHCESDVSAIQSSTDTADTSENMSSSSSTADQTENKVEEPKQKFEALVSEISATLENVNHRIEILPDEMTLIYKRVGKHGKHSLIHYDVIVNSNCRVCDKTFPTPFQARIHCCETKPLIPWAVSYPGGREAGDMRFPSLQDLVEHYKFMPKKDMLVYHCPFRGCKWTSSGSPNFRHVNEQHMLFDAKDKKQPVLCTIGDCGLYMKRPDEKMKQHRASVHGHEVDKWNKPVQLPAFTPVILAALVPDKFYEAGLNYYLEEFEYKARRGVLEETEAEEPVPRRSLASRRKSKIEAEETPAPRRSSSRVRSNRNKSDKSATKEESEEKPRRSTRKSRKNVDENNRNNSQETVDACVIHNSPQINFKMDDGLEDFEPSNGESYSDYENNMFEVSSISSDSDSDCSFYCWCDEDEENFRVDSRTLPRLEIPPKALDLDVSPRRRRFGNLNDLEQFRDFYNWASGPMI